MAKGKRRKTNTSSKNCISFGINVSFFSHAKLIAIANVPIGNIYFIHPIIGIIVLIFMFSIHPAKMITDAVENMEERKELRRERRLEDDEEYEDVFTSCSALKISPNSFGETSCNVFFLDLVFFIP